MEPAPDEEKEEEKEEEEEEVAQEAADVVNEQGVPAANVPDQSIDLPAPPVTSRVHRSGKIYAAVEGNLSSKKATSLYGEEAVTESEEKEMLGLYKMGAFDPVNYDDLKPEQKKNIIPSHLFLKRKTDANGVFVKLKARLVAGGNVQDRSLPIYESITSPTVSLTALNIVAAIAAKESRQVVTVDVAQAYLNAEMGDTEVFMRIEPKLGKILNNIDSKFKGCASKSGAVYVRLRKALYGCIESALLWFNTISKFMRSAGFSANTYDQCVFNKVLVSGDIITVLIYVDDLFVTCVDGNAVEDFLSDLKKRFGTTTEHRGKTHSFLGMFFDFTEPGRVTISMDGYIADLLEFCDVGDHTAKTPATSNLFVVSEVNEDNPLLEDKDARFFHTVVAKLLYLAKRVRSDTLGATVFLTGRVQCPTVEDQDKLARVVKYINGSKSLSLTLEMHFDNIAAYVDASYAVHHDLKSHTGVVLTLGKGAVYVGSSKQKIVAKSSTEAELIALSDAHGEILWTRSFLNEVLMNNRTGKPAIIYEDNMSTIAILKSRKTFTQRTKHINIRYFFIRDCIFRGEAIVVHKPTGDMIADIHTKAIQGKLFLHLRKLLLNHT